MAHESLQNEDVASIAQKIQGKAVAQIVRTDLGAQLLGVVAHAL